MVSSMEYKRPFRDVRGAPPPPLKGRNRRASVELDRTHPIEAWQQSRYVREILPAKKNPASLRCSLLFPVEDEYAMFS